MYLLNLNIFYKMTNKIIATEFITTGKDCNQNNGASTHYPHKSLHDCMKICKNDFNCRSVSHNPGNGSCYTKSGVQDLSGPDCQVKHDWIQYQKYYNTIKCHEGGHCTMSNINIKNPSMSYGADGIYIKSYYKDKNHGFSIRCDNRYGDPVPGRRKECFFKFIVK
jgi:hypothetical protein